MSKKEYCEETKEEYVLNIKEKKYNNIYVKNIYYLLQNKDKIIKIINSYLNPMIPIKKENIKICSELFLKRKYNLSDYNSLYIDDKKLIFYLILYKNKVDINLPYKILNYCIDIIQEWSKKNKDIRKKQYPVVVPIVIYSGQEKWNISRDFKYQQMNFTIVDDYKINLKYNLVSISKIVNSSDLNCISEIEDFIVIESLR